MPYGWETFSELLGLFSLWISRHDQLALYRPGLLSAERIILRDALEEETLRLDSVASTEAMEHLIQNRATDQLTDINQSARTDASFVTRSPLQGKILQKLDAPSRLSRRMIKVEIPFLKDLSLQDIFRIRTDYEPRLTAFRRSLRDCAVKTERASGPDEIRLLQQRFQERIADEGLDELYQKLSIWKRRSMQDTALLAVPAVLGYMGSLSLLNMAAGAVSLLQVILPT